MVDRKEEQTTDPVSPPEEASALQEQEAEQEVEKEARDGAAEEAVEGEIKQVALMDLQPEPGVGLKNNLDLLMDVTVPITVELGRSTMKIEDVLQLVSGSVIELDKRADEPIDLKVNGRLVARGEIVVVDDFFGIRVNEILDPGTSEA